MAPIAASECPPRAFAFRPAESIRLHEHLRTLGADLVRFCASLRVLFCTILQGDVFVWVQKAWIYWGFSWCCR